MKYRRLVLLFMFLSWPVPLFAAADTMVNIDQLQNVPATLQPGAIILLPDNRQAVIMEQLPNGDLLTDLDIVISPDGIILSEDGKGQQVRLDPEFYSASIKDGASGIEIPAIAGNTAAGVKKEAVTPVVRPEVKTSPKIAEVEKPATTPKTQLPARTPGTVKVPEKTVQQPDEQLTLAQLLPMTNINTGKPKEEKKQAGAPETKKVEPQKTSPAKEQEKKPAMAKKPEQKAPAKTEKPKAEPSVKNGQELRIPQEAIKTGNLDFLEGCWQGTRPEYYSKRTIRECFCFGTGGKTGKRRIYDHARMCIGGTRASLSKSGVLSVTSSGAACNDGERWGSAEMVCRNSGPKTPCSWVFRDANNGSQSYTIPFVRVQSCGR